jgi:hypothetical protein
MVFAELLSVGPVVLAGGGMLASDNTRSSVAKFYRFIRDSMRIKYLYRRRNRHERFKIYL